MIRLRWLVGLAVQLGLLALLGSCVTVPVGQARLRSIIQSVPGANPPWQLAGDARGVTVRRGGVGVRVNGGMSLLPGDEITTEAGTAAVLELGGQLGEAILDEHTSVRLGSLEVFFGKVFADLRGLFVVRSETVEAVNEGTRYLFDVIPGQSTRVVVVEGSLTLRPRRGSWSPVRTSAQRALVADDPGTSIPRLAAADTRDITARYAGIRGALPAPTSGFCCLTGRVTPAMSNQCNGNFWPFQSLAEKDCRPAPPPPVKPTVPGTPTSRPTTVIN